jgi:hypothetical protein
MTMADIDDMLREALQRIAPDADPSGVADSIRARVDAGDTGAPASSSGFDRRLRRWLPFVGLIVVAALIGAGLGLSGLLGHPVVYASQAARSVPAITATATAAPTPTPSATVAPIAPVASAPAVRPAPPKPKDTTGPSLAVGAPNPATIYGTDAPNPCATVTTVTTTAHDVSGVVAIHATSSFPGTVIHQSGPASSTTFTFSMPYTGTTSPDLTVTITVTASDGAGNSTSLSRTFTLTSSSLCLI